MQKTPARTGECVRTVPLSSPAGTPCTTILRATSLDVKAPAVLCPQLVKPGSAAQAAFDEPALSKRLILAGVFCVPPGSSLSADLAADLPGPAAISLPASVAPHTPPLTSQVR